MIARRNYKHGLVMGVLLVTVQTVSQTQDRQKRNIFRLERSGTDPPLLENSTEAAMNMTWDPKDPADYSDGHSRDHHHDYDHYDKVHGHPNDHPERPEPEDHPQDEDTVSHDRLHPHALAYHTARLRHPRSAPRR